MSADGGVKGAAAETGFLLPQGSVGRLQNMKTTVTNVERYRFYLYLNATALMSAAFLFLGG